MKDTETKKRTWIKPIELISIIGLLLIMLLSIFTIVEDVGKAKSTEKAQHIQLHSNKKLGAHLKEKPEKPEKPIEQEKNDEVQFGKTVYLTFDDGPNAHSQGILNLLEHYQVQATFFMLEPSMRQHPAAVKRMVNDGHSVGLHGVTHNANIIYQSSQSVINEMLTAQETLQAITGVRTQLIRVPYGSVPHMKPAYLQAVQQHGYQLWDWTIDSKDWKYSNGEYVTDVLNQLHTYPYEHQPKVILLHEKDTTLQYLDQLLQALLNQGYELKPLHNHMEPYTF